MSGVEEAVAAAEIASLFISVGSSIAESAALSDAAEDADAITRREQVQLRIQESQESVSRMRDMERLLASEEVQLGVRNISPASGTARAITQESIINFREDEQAASLNYASRQLALLKQNMIMQKEVGANQFAIATNAGKEVLNVGMAEFRRPGSTLLNQSTKTPYVNRTGTRGFEKFRDNFNLNR